MLGNLTGWHLIVILAVVLLLFGATRLPALSKSIGQSMRIFKNETKSLREGDDRPSEPSPDTPPQAVSSVPSEDPSHTRA